MQNHGLHKATLNSSRIHGYLRSYSKHISGAAYEREGNGSGDEGGKNQFFKKKEREGFAQPSDSHEPQVEEYNNFQYCTPEAQERQQKQWKGKTFSWLVRRPTYIGGKAIYQCSLVQISPFSYSQH